MTKITVEALAKQLKKTNTEVLKALEKIGVFVPNAKAALELDEIRRVCIVLTGKEPRIRRVAKSKPEEAANAAAGTAGQTAPDKTAKAEEPAAKPAEPAKSEPAKTEPVQAESAKTETVKAEPAKTDAAKTDAANAESVKTESATENKPAVKTEEPAAKPETKQTAPKAAAADQKAAQPAKVPEGAAEAPKATAKTDDAQPTAAKPAAQSGTAAKNAAPTRTGAPVRTAQTARPAGQTAQRPSSAAGSQQPVRRAPQGQRPAGTSSAGTGTRYDNRTPRPGQGTGTRPQGQGTSSGNRPARPYGTGTGTGRPQDGAGQKNWNNKRGTTSRQGGLSIPTAPKEAAIQDDKPKKSDRMRRDKDKEREKARIAAKSDSFNRRHKNLMVTEGDEGFDENVRSHVKKPKNTQNTAVVQEEEIKVVQLPPVMTVREFAEAVRKPVTQIIKSLMLKGKMMGANDDIEYADCEALAMDMDILAEPMKEEDIFKKYRDVEDKEEDLQPRPPVVVVMGHVDHGKTSLLDAIRNTHVTAGEAGGITQHIGASIVSINGRSITFLDTPGHEAFTAMRMRGAQVTDIAVLVVAADDGIMPQTIEAINHAKAAGVQIIVAINKIDRPDADPERVKQQLMQYELVPEEWGGSTPCVPVSAKTGQGISDLLEMITLTADILELKANPNRPAVGHVVEAELDKGRGVVATCLVQHGTLHVGDTVVVGKTYGRIKAMTDDKGRKTKVAGPSGAVEIQGLSEVPTAGEPFYVTEDDRSARLLAEKVSAREREKLLEGTKKVSLDSLFEEIQAGEVKTLNIIIKADVQGSVEAVKQSLEKLSSEKVAVRVIHGAVGAINESDVMLASASNSIIIGFNVRPDAGAKSVSEQEKVDIRLYRIIYDAINDIQKAMEGMLEPEFKETVTGHATVRQTFKASGVGTIAGSYITDGKITRSSKCRLIRDSVVVYEGEIDSLRRFKDDVREVATGYECGILLKDFADIKEGDVIEAFVMEQIKRQEL